MEEESKEKERLLQILRDEVNRLLLSGDISEQEKLSRIKLAQEIMENGEGQL